MRTLGLRAREAMGLVAANCERYDVPVSLESIFLCAVELWDESREILDEAQRDELFRNLCNVAGDAPNEISPWFDGLCRRGSDTEYISLRDMILSLASSIGERLERMLAPDALDVRTIVQRIEQTPDDVTDGPVPIEPQGALRYAVVISGPGFVHDGNRYDRLQVAEAAKRHFERLLVGADIDTSGPMIPFGFHLPSNFHHATHITIRELDSW